MDLFFIYKLTFYCKGITIVIGGQLIYWNLALDGGFWPFCLTTLLVGTGYLCLTLCLSEMTSFLPFAGDSSLLWLFHSPNFL